MGQQVPCTATWEKQSSNGNAQLETDHVLFRGDFRVKIGFDEMTKVTAKGGVLRIASRQGPLSLELGPRAEKWADKILNPPSVLDKLGVKPEQRISVVGRADDAFVAALEKRPDLSVSRRARKDSDHIFLFADSKASGAKLGSLISSLTPAGGVWVVYPKGRREFSESDVLMLGRDAGLKDVKVVKFSERDTALKFVVPLERR